MRRARLCSRTCRATATGIPVSLQALLSAGAVCSGVASRAVVAECTSVGSAAGLWSVSTGRVALLLVEVVAAPILVLYSTGGLLVRSRLIGSRLIEPRLIGAGLIHSGLIGRTHLLAIVLRKI